MGNRITPAHMFVRAQFDLNGAFARLARVQNQISTGKRLNAFSDSPSDASRALDLRTTLLRTIQSRDAVTSARFAADQQASTLEEISTLVSAARAKAEQAAAGTLSKGDRETIATELDVMLDQIIGLANQRLEGRYLFAGSNVNVVPFQVTRSFGSITSVRYRGDSIARTVQLGPKDVKPIEVTGAEVFGSLDREPTQIVGQTGLVPTPGASDTMTGDAKIVIEHASTIVGDALLAGIGDSVSGLLPGASSASDTIIGAHSIEVVADPGGGGTISLDGGEPVAYTVSETDLAMTAPDGATIHLNVSGLTPGFSGTVQVEGLASISINDQPAQTMAVTADLALQDGKGRVVHLDTTGVRKSGESMASFPGTESLFDVMIGLRDDIRGGAGFSGDHLTNRIQARLASLDTMHDDILNSLAKLGARAASFDRIESSLSLFELTVREKQGNLEDTDLLTASVELAEAESAYQSALAAAARLSRPTLLNFL